MRYADVGRIAQDLNGDGYGDIAIALNGDAVTRAGSGRAAIFWGGAAPHTAVDLAIQGPIANDGFGAVSEVGDLNADGYGDMVVGATRDDTVATDAGRLYVYFGGANMDTTPDIVLNGDGASARFGGSSGAGDLNGDGYGDLVVASLFDGGRIYMYMGPTLSASNSVMLVGQAAGEDFSRMASVGDMNGDGYSDVLVGARLNDANGTDAGRAYLFLGGSTPDSIPDLTMTGAAAGDMFGYSLSTAGDVDGDGYADALVGAVNSAITGQAYLFVGGPVISDQSRLTYSITQTVTFDDFGFALGSPGDVDGDGYSDIVVTAINTNNVGRSYIYQSRGNPTTVPDVILSGATTTELFGYFVFGFGDVNGDGFADFGIGDNPPAGTVGIVNLYLGGSFIGTDPFRTFSRM